MKESTDWPGTHGDDFGGFSAKFDQDKPTGYRMDKVSAWDDNGVPRYALVPSTEPGKKDPWSPTSG